MHCSWFSSTFSFPLFLLCCVGLVFPSAMTKVVDRVPITPSPSCGTERFITVHRYGPSDETVEKCYIQASLHSDEVPAMLVAHKLIKMLDACDQRGEILKRVIIVPHANPIGLSQNILNSGIGVKCYCSIFVWPQSFYCFTSLHFTYSDFRR